jgi:3-hydroxyisobutyrate dehydrogenase
MAKTLGFIGIGLMGRPMVLRLLAAGFVVNVWNRTLEKLNSVVASGAHACLTVPDLISASDIIILCLADTNAVEIIVQSHMAEPAIGGKLIIDLSSIAPASTQRLSLLIQAQGACGWVDAPVSGGVSGAEQGSLAIMAGGTLANIETARQVLAPLYRQLTHMGDVGSGQIAKICNQMIVSCNVLVIAEMMALAEKAGIAAEKMPEALAGGFADSKPLQIIAPQMAAGVFEPVKWRVKTLLKDLNLAHDLALDHESAIPMSALAAQLLELHGGYGFLEHDPSTLIRLFKPD